MLICALYCLSSRCSASPGPGPPLEAAQGAWPELEVAVVDYFKMGCFEYSSFNILDKDGELSNADDETNFECTILFLGL